MSLILEEKRKSLNKKEVLREPVFLFFCTFKMQYVFCLPVMWLLKKQKMCQNLFQHYLTKGTVFVLKIYQQSLNLNLLFFPVYFEVDILYVYFDPLWHFTHGIFHSFLTS